MERYVSEILGQLRKERHIPASFVASRVGVTRQTLLNKESGKSDLSFRQTVKYCNAIGISLEQLLEYL